MKAKRGTLLLILLGAFSTARIEAGGTSALDAVVARTRDYYRHSPGIVADFTQTLESRTLPAPQEESGTVSIKPPGRMRWEYRHPRGKLAVTDGQRAFLYLPDDRQVLVGPLESLDSGAIASRLLNGAALPGPDFSVEGEPLPERAGIWILKLSPRTPDFPYDAVTVEVAGDSGAIQSIRLLDPLGNRIEYRFQNIRIVRDLPDRLFTYKIPRGVDIQNLGTTPSSSASP